MNREKILTSEQIRKILDVSANKNNNLLIFFFTFGLYILISTLGTTDVALLLPKQGFKMPLIDFELDLLSFFVLGPLLLLLLHFNLLFSHYKHLEKLNTYKDEVDISSIDPSLYSFAFMMGNRGFSGRMINLTLWLLLYILPLLVFIIIYIRFADYHHAVITPLHLAIIILDLVFIVSSIVYNNNFYSSKHSNLPYGKFNIFYSSKHANPLHSKSNIISLIVFISTGLLMGLYFCVFFYPITYGEYNPSYLQKIKNDLIPKAMCWPVRLISSEDEYCYPRLIVTEEEMAKISPAALYIPRHLSIKNINEQELILKHGTRIDLSNRNLRYANLRNNILTRANFKNSELQATDLREAQLQATNLYSVKLQDANLMRANLQSAHLDGKVQLQGANLILAQMQNAYLRDSNFTNAQMQSANLFLADFSNADLRNVDFRNANITLANFTNAILVGASFSDANLTSSSFQDAILVGTDFTGAHFPKAKMTVPYFRTVPHFGTVLYFKYAQIQGFNMCNTELKEKKVDNREIPYFKDAQLQGANLYNTKIREKDVNLTTIQLETSVCVKIPDKNRWFNSRKVEYLKDGIKQISSKKQMAENEKDKIISQLQDIQCEAYTKMKERFNDTKEKLCNKNKTQEMSMEDKESNQLYIEYVESLVESYKSTCPVSIAH